jgi:DIS3-like exonuclease 2
MQAEGDLVAITLDPIACGTRMKGPNVVAGANPLVCEVGEMNGGHSGKKGQTDVSCKFGKCSNGIPVPDRMHHHHKNSGFSKAVDRMHHHHKNSGFSKAVKCENGNATVLKNYERDLNDANSEASRALQSICDMVYSHPSRRPTGSVISRKEVLNRFD